MQKRIEVDSFPNWSPKIQGSYGGAQLLQQPLLQVQIISTLFRLYMGGSGT